jgi:glycosyltransferase involved in cell wall biosynthesis
LSSKESVTVVLNVYKRGVNLSQQLEAIYSQSHAVSEILIWENGEDEIPDNIDKENLVIARSSSNLGVWARFAFALNATSDFIWIIDDDCFPGNRWLEIALETFRKNPGIIGSRGLRFSSSSSYSLYKEFGPNFPNEDVEAVDIVGHNWIFPREWLSYFWSEYGDRFNSTRAGEDIHLSYAIKKHLNLGCYVPPQPANNRNLWGELPGRLQLDGTDLAGISVDIRSLRKFEKAYRHYVDLGFMPLTMTEVGDSQPGIARELIGHGVGRFPVIAHKIAKFLRIGKR